ncbi:hypothetical protein [Candidatus Roseilinea sp. NK_OTU-006]|nr:hypothetical protein [Candidatus Roseilinea sp. NK_OTU-006]
MSQRTRLICAGWIAGVFALSACAQSSSELPTTMPGDMPVTVYAPPRPASGVPPTASPTSVPSAQITQATPAATMPTPTETPYPLPKISLSGEGINVVDYRNDNLRALEPLGFGWIQVFNPPEHPILNYKVLYRVPLGDAISGNPAAVNAWADQLESLARERRGVIHAYSIGNEVNLSREWGGRPPDPSLYARLLAIAYARIKTADPDALVISAGIAPTGGDGDGAMDDLAYARALFEAGMAGYIDGYGFHPYGFAYEPEHDPDDPQARGLLFRRAEAHRRLMEEYGAGDKPMWATEFGWLMDPREEGLSCTWPELDWQRVSRKRQAEYVVRAFDFARKNWPWMGPMFLWNYDFSRSAQYPDPCEQMKFFSLLDAQGNERPVMQALRAATRKER